MRRLNGWSNDDEMIKARKQKDNRTKKIKYWKKHYGVDIKDHQYELFSQHSTEIKRVLHILDFVQTLRLIEN